jgi:glycosyltransferase involved in cell wall biosynthesis
MPSYHLAMAWEKDYGALERRAAEGLGPRFAIPPLLRRLGADLHQAVRDAKYVSLRDRALGRLIGVKESWALARRLAAGLGKGDVLYCLDADIGIPMAAALRGKSNRPKLAVFFHNIIRPRGRLATKLLGIRDTVDIFCSCCSSQLEFLRAWLNLGEDRTKLLLQDVDNRFYSPGPATPDKKRPLIAAVGLEKRDYVTLAAATSDLDIDVVVDAWSAHAHRLSRSFPRQIPANMSFRTSTPTELVQLYRDADVVAVPLLPNSYSGITTLLEGLACRRPVVASRTVGLADYLSPPDGITPVEPSNPAALREAILHLLQDSEAAGAQARRGHQSVELRYDFDRYTEKVAGMLEAL